MIGVIADDFTGGSDVAVAFRRGGLRTVLYFGPPTDISTIDEVDVIVICLKSRTAPVAEAVSASVAAGQWLRARGAAQLFFKYCSTFDSTETGNIGPVSDALLEQLGATIVPMTPASPAHGRTQYNGYLFVEDRLLGESHMRHHPLTPMTDSYLPRVMAAQTKHRIGTVPLAVVRRGPDAIRKRLDSLSSAGNRYALIDAVTEGDLALAGQAIQESPLITGAAGLARGLADARPQDPTAEMTAPREPSPAGRAAVLAGSCSARTLEQIDAMHEAGRPAHYLDPLAGQDADDLAENALSWYDQLPAEADAPLIYSSVEPDQLRRIQDRLGAQRAADLLEATVGRVAIGLAKRGVRRIVCAGGETSGAIVSALTVPGGVVGAEAAAGVPWIFPQSPSNSALLLKSGNFGNADLLVRASSTRVE